MEQPPGSRYQIVEFSNAPPEVQDIYVETQEAFDLGFVLNWFKCQAMAPSLLRANWQKIKAVLFEGKIPLVVKYMIIYSISKSRESHYCSQVFGILADKLSHTFSDDPVFRITNNLFAEEIPLRFKNAVKVATKAALSPTDIQDEDFTSLMEAGFSRVELMEIMAQADLANMLNTVADLSGIRTDSNFIGI